MKHEKEEAHSAQILFDRKELREGSHGEGGSRRGDGGLVQLQSANQIRHDTHHHDITKKLFYENSTMEG